MAVLTDWVDNTTPELAAAWYPVAWSHEVTDRPVGVQLLGRHWVLARLGGELVAFVDECPHRLIPLSGGELCGETLRCAYHGWQFDRQGTAVVVPSHLDGTPIPARAHLIAPAGLQERYGAVWLAPEPPVAPLPEFPGWDDPAFECRLDVPYRTTASAAQFMDNGCDTSHFFMAHRDTFGGDETAMSFPRSVERNGWTVTAVYDAPYKVLEDPDVIAGRADEERWKDCLEIEERVILEDCRALGLYRDHRLPLDLQAEVHVRSDKLSIAYRRLLKDLVDRQRQPATDAEPRAVRVAG